MEITLGCGQLTWPRTLPEEEILAEIAETGYDGAPGDGGPPDRPAEETLALYARFGMLPGPGYLSGPFWVADRAEALVEAAGRKARLMRAFGCTELYVAADSTPDRLAAAGHVRPEDGLTAAGYAQFAATLNRVSEATLRAGVRACFHNHAGTYIETRAEVERLYEQVDRSLVFLGPDTGHLAWAGDDVVSFFRDHLDAIKTLHIKDIDPRVRAAGVAEGWGYRTFTDRGIFCEIGEGLVDFPALFALLEGANFTGWIIVETDVTQKPSARISAATSRENLRKMGV